MTSHEFENTKFWTHANISDENYWRNMRNPKEV